VRKLIKPFIFVSSAWAATLTAPAFAQDTGAQGSGNWENASTWTGGAVPNSSNNVYIGSTYPAGAAGTATVTLTAAESANNVNVGYGSPTNGTLDLGGNTLTVTGGLNIGQFGGTGTLNEGGGSFTASNLLIYNNNSLTLGTADVTSTIDIEIGATLTTAATGNITSGGSVANAATLNLGANMNLSGGLNVEGTGATLNLVNHTLTANTLYLGYFLSSPVNLNRGGTKGTFSVSNLYLGNGQNLTMIAGDTVSGAGGTTNIYSGATLTTATTTNITDAVNVDGGTLNLGANLNIGSNGMNVEGSGTTLNLAGHNFTAGTLDLGFFDTSAVTFERGSPTAGALTLGSLSLGNGQNLALISTDKIGNSTSSGTIDIETGATLTTAATANVVNNTVVKVIGGTLTLGAAMNIANNDMTVAGSGATLNLAGHNLTASALSLGYISTPPVTFERGTGTLGTLAVTTLFIGNTQNLALISGDRISTAEVVGGTLTTAATANISNALSVGISASGLVGTVNLGANLSLGGNLDVQDSGTTFNANGYAVSAAVLYLGWNGSAPVTVSNLGAVTATDLAVGNGTSVTLHGGDVISSQIDLKQSSVLTVLESASGTGLTLNGTSTSDLTIDPSTMDLIFTSLAPLTPPNDWAFRWTDPRTGNWISTLTTMIDDHQITLTLPSGETYEILNSGGYTYIDALAIPVPLPSSLAMTGLCLAGLGAARMRRRWMGIASRPLA
jgi:fibronectin-binding autotransporter adhesin